MGRQRNVQDVNREERERERDEQTIDGQPCEVFMSGDCLDGGDGVMGEVRSSKRRGPHRIQLGVGGRREIGQAVQAVMGQKQSVQQLQAAQCLAACLTAQTITRQVDRLQMRELRQD